MVRGVQEGGEAWIPPHAHFMTFEDPASRVRGHGAVGGGQDLSRCFATIVMRGVRTGGLLGFRSLCDCLKG